MNYPTKSVYEQLYAEVKIRRALGPMAHKIVCGPSGFTLGGPAGPADFEAVGIW